jgi:hypothetical protein
MRFCQEKKANLINKNKSFVGQCFSIAFENPHIILFRLCKTRSYRGIYFVGQGFSLAINPSSNIHHP